jgi:hypothetical protein
MKKKEVEEEVAITIELGHIGVRNRDIIKKTDCDRIIQILTAHFNVNRLNLTRRNNKIYGNQRDITIYILSVIGRVAYKELAEMFYVKPPAIGESVKRAINLMIENVSISQEVDSLIQQIA